MARRSIVIAALFFLSGILISAETEHWLHVRVEKTGAGSDHLRINIPLSMVESFLPLIPEEKLSRGRIDIGGHRWNKVELRQLWENLKLQPATGLFSVQKPGSTLKVALEGEYLTVHTEEGSAEQVDIRIPIQAVDALLSGPGDELNLPAAVQALKESQPNEIVSVRSRTETVRVWIGERADSP